HTGEWPWECGKGFRHSSNLICHHGIHSSKRPYSCLQWGKSFKHTSQLKVHQKTHQETPYECPQCRKSF
ncbi:ZFP27 protein, partial [Origma solitaria]|nr:ZFP27 protein [Origma solitaria]